MRDQVLREDEQTELKEGWSERTLEDIAAFANHRGGTLWLGVRDDGTAKGFDANDVKQQAIANQIVDTLGIRPSLTWHSYGGNRVLAIRVNPAFGLVSYKGRHLTRVGSTNREMSFDQIADLVLKRSGRTWDALVAPIGTEGVSKRAVREFIRLARPRLTSLRRGEAAERVLGNLTVLTDRGLTNAGVLLFGVNPQSVFPTARVRVGRFHRWTVVDDRWLDGTLVEQLDGVEQAFRQYLQARYEIPAEGSGIEALQRREVWEYPLEALRELVINALIHRDYAALGDIQARIYDDRLEIWNPGGLPDGLKPEDLLREGHLSKPRNPLLARVFFLAGLVEQWGTGTTRVIVSCQSAGLPEPEFSEEAGGFKVVLRKNPFTPEWLRSRGLHERLIQAVLFVKEHGAISNRDYQKLTGLKERAATADLNVLVEVGALERIGTRGPGTHYVLRKPQTPQ